MTTAATHQKPSLKVKLKNWTHKKWAYENRTYLPRKEHRCLVDGNTNRYDKNEFEDESEKERQDAD